MQLPCTDRVTADGSSVVPPLEAIVISTLIPSAIVPLINVSCARRREPGIQMLLSRLGSPVRKTFAEELASRGLRPAHYGVLAVLPARARVSLRSSVRSPPR